eukprot:869829-Prorocentrum_minimum.AAC.2
MNSLMSTHVLPSCATELGWRVHMRRIPRSRPALARDVRRTLCRAEKSDDTPGHKDVDPNEVIYTGEDVDPVSWETHENIMLERLLHMKRSPPRVTRFFANIEDGLKADPEIMSQLQAQQRELEEMMNAAETNENNARSVRDVSWTCHLSDRVFPRRTCDESLHTVAHVPNNAEPPRCRATPSITKSSHNAPTLRMHRRPPWRSWHPSVAPSRT